jgi:hypothetical protein
MVMEVVKYGDYEGRELIPAYHMRLVRKGGAWHYRYSGMDIDHACFENLEDALISTIGDLFDVVIIDVCDVIGCKCLNCSNETARVYKWNCKSLKNNRLIPTTTEVVVNE